MVAIGSTLPLLPGGIHCDRAERRRLALPIQDVDVSAWIQRDAGGTAEPGCAAVDAGDGCDVAVTAERIDGHIVAAVGDEEGGR